MRALAAPCFALLLGLAAGAHAESSESPEPRPPHPDPRVIVNVTSVRGPHERAGIERALRLRWGRIIRCYNTIDPNAKGMVRLTLAVSATGKVTRATRTKSTLGNTELAACLTDVMSGVSVPKASARSTARAEIHVAPGDR